MTKRTLRRVNQSFGRLDRLVKRAMKQTGVSGVAPGVVFDDQVLYQNGYGVRLTETKERVQAETVFQLASLSTFPADQSGHDRRRHRLGPLRG